MGAPGCRKEPILRFRPRFAEPLQVPISSSHDTARLMPDFKTIANFRKDNGPAIRTPAKMQRLKPTKHKCSPVPINSYR
jgi:hypothetical protein